MRFSRGVGGIIVTVGLAGSVLAGCGSDPEVAAEDEPASSTTLSTTSTTAAAVADPQEVSGSASSRSDRSSSGAAEIPEAGETDPKVLDETAVGRSITLSKIFRDEGGWEESRYDIADRTAVHGIGTSMDQCGEDYAHELELRLARNFERLTFNVGQANDSPSSDEQVIVAVDGNGSQLDIRDVPFDVIQDFDLDVVDVNALKIRVWLDKEECRGYSGGGAVAVVDSITLR